MSLRLNYYVAYANGILDQCRVQPENNVAEVRQVVYEDQKVFFEHYDLARGELNLYAPSHLKAYPREGIPGQIDTVISSLKPLPLTTRVVDVFRSNNFDESLVHLVVIRHEDGSLEDFLRSTTLPARTVVHTKSTTTHPYDTLLSQIEPEMTPYRLVKFDTMAQIMTDDLFGRVLPTRPLSDPISLTRAKESVRVYRDSFAKQPLIREASVVNSTQSILTTCIFCASAVGLQYKIDGEITNKVANVRMDSTVRVSDTGTSSGGIAVEDKSPAVYRKHCSDSEVDRTVGSLVLGSVEHGFRGILFKLTIYMIYEKLRWGLIHCGVNMRIVRIEYRDGRPYVIISEQVYTGSPAPKSIYSLICYMLLTANEEIQFFDGIRVAVPAPPPIKYIGQTRMTTRLLNLPHIEEAEPGTSSSVVLHTTAAAGREVVDIPMLRADNKSLISSRNPRNIDVYITDFLGAGGFGRVFRGHAFAQDEIYCGPLVVKLSKTGLEEYLTTEATAYGLLDGLYDAGVPRYYGHFSGAANGIQYSCILINYSGHALETFDDLSLPQRMEIFHIFWKIHQAGIVHNDARPSNVMQSKSSVQVIDFSCATFNHQCEGTDACEELINIANELRLNRGHIRTALLSLRDETGCRKNDFTITDKSTELLFAQGNTERVKSGASELRRKAPPINGY